MIYFSTIKIFLKGDTMGVIKYQVFVSSTYEDLKEERKEVTQAILECDCFPAGMELFPASNRSQWDIIKKVIDESDFYLVVIAGRYGSMGIDDSGAKVSYTEMEFDYAMKNGKPILALIHEDIDQLPSSKTEKNANKIRKLKKFYEKACAGRVIKKWNNKDNLKSAVLSAIVDLKEETEAVGWIKANYSIDKAGYKIFEEQRMAYTGQISHIKKELNKVHRDIDEKNRYCVDLEKKIDRLTKITNEFYQREENRGIFWVMLAEINFKYEYFMSKHDNLQSDLAEECNRDLSCEEINFLRYYNHDSLWENATRSSFEINLLYDKMQNDEKGKYINGIKTSLKDYISEDDLLVVSDECIANLFATCFFLIRTFKTEKVVSLKNMILEKRNGLFVVCNEVMSELWEIEIALCENDD